MRSRLCQCGRRMRLSVVCPDDAHTQEALGRALSEGWADVWLAGDARAYAPLVERYGPERVVVARASDAAAAARLAVEAVRAGRADVLVKGLVRSDVLLRAVLDKKAGLVRPGAVVTHVAVAQPEGYGRLLFFSDAAVIPSPTCRQRSAQIGYLARACRCFGVTCPAIALLHCSEAVSERFPVTLHYEALKRQAIEGAFGPVCLDGPMDITAACVPGAAQVKHIRSAVAGQADALLLPDLEAANLFYKCLSLLGRAEVAGALQGTDCPVVLTSRTDSAATKFNSLAFAAALAAF